MAKVSKTEALKALDEVIRAFESMQYQSSYETVLHNKLKIARSAF